MRKNKKREIDIFNDPIEISKLRLYAKMYLERNVTDEEIRKTDITDILFDELAKILENKELLNIAVTGETTSGKSTIVLQLVEYVNQLMGNKMKMEYITADQYEFSRRTLEDWSNCCFAIDEVSALESTGWNATIEQKYLEQFNEVQAQRYLHRISASPIKVQDLLTSIILRVENKDIKNKRTVALVYYKEFSPKGNRIQLVGKATFDVSHVMKQDWYRRYREKKDARMALTHKHGIFQKRQLYFANVVLNTYYAIAPLIGTIRPNKDLIEAKAKRELQEAKIPITSLAIEHIKSEVNGLLIQKQAQATLEKALGKKGITEEKSNMLRNQLRLIMEGLQKDVGRYEKIQEVANEYDRI